MDDFISVRVPRYYLSTLFKLFYLTQNLGGFISASTIANIHIPHGKKVTINFE